MLGCHAHGGTVLLDCALHSKVPSPCPHNVNLQVSSNNSAQGPVQLSVINCTMLHSHVVITGIMMFGIATTRMSDVRACRATKATTAHSISEVVQAYLELFWPCQLTTQGDTRPEMLRCTVHSVFWQYHSRTPHLSSFIPSI